MMQAVHRFDPDRGFRLATYAMWWIRAAIQEYVLHSSSLVKMGTTAAQKKLFFNLRRLKGQMNALDNGDLPPEQASRIAEALDVPVHDVVTMNLRMAVPDQSLNAPIHDDSVGPVAGPHAGRIGKPRNGAGRSRGIRNAQGATRQGCFMC